MAVPKYQTGKNVEILGAALVAIAENRNVTQFEDLVQEFGFHRIDPDRWYNFQWELDFMRALAERMNSTENMVAIGVEVFDNIVLPDSIRTIEDGIHMLNEILHANMRNVPRSYEYLIKPAGRNRLHVTDNTPFPHDLIYGYLYGLSKNLMNGRGRFTVKRDYMNPRNPDISGAHYEIEWE